MCADLWSDLQFLTNKCAVDNVWAAKNLFLSLRLIKCCKVPFGSLFSNDNFSCLLSMVKTVFLRHKVR